MTRFLALTLLIGFFAFLPSASADGENGLHITPADTRQTANSGSAMLTLNAANIQVRAEWRLDGDSPFAINDNGELRLTVTLSDPDKIVATVIVEDMFSELNSGYQNLAATALITVEFIHKLRIINPPENMLFAAFGIGRILHTFQTSGGKSAPTFHLYSASSDFYLDKLGGVLSVGANAAVGIYTLTVQTSDTATTLQITATVAVMEALTLKAKVSDRTRDLQPFNEPYASAYSIVAGNDDGYFAIGKTSGVLSVQAWTPVGNYPLGIGITYTFSLGIPPKVVVSAVVVEITDYPTPTQRKIYVLGGYAYPNRYNDVWSSVNGTNWSLEISSAVWSGRSEHQALLHNGRLYVLGGYDGSSRNDVWSSADGKNWLRETDDAGWTGRNDHQAVSHNGRLYVLGGRDNNSNRLNDVWSSADGINWEEETDDAGWSGRYEHQAVSHNGRLYVLGGYINSYPYRLNDVWSSADGKNWSRETNDAGWAGREEHQALSHNGRIYVLGGIYGYRNDVWSSANGKNWVLETDDAGWAGRSDHQALSHNGRLYVLGGYDGSSRNDVWSSADGKNWGRETNSAGWTRRHGHQAVVFPSSLVLFDVGEKITITVGVAVDNLHTFTATNGKGNYTYSLNTEVSGFDVSPGGVLSADDTATRGEYTLTVWVEDGAGNRAQTAVRVFVAYLNLAEVPRLFGLASIAKVLHTITTDGGIPGKQYAIVAGNKPDYFALDADSGVLSLLTTALEGVYTLSVEVSDSSSLSRKATAVATVEIKGMQIFVLGGYYIGSLNDVWSSADGKNWGRETDDAGWSERNQHQALSHNERLYVLGGRDGLYNSDVLNDVWSSADGKNWQRETANTGWSGRRGHQALSHQRRLYVLGGYGGGNDVWSSADGKNWGRETANAGWSGRYLHQALSHNGRLYVLGGYDGSSRNDVWSSVDGKNWRRETDDAEWSGRWGHQALSHNGRLYVLGGRYGPYSSNRLNDVWSSANGKNWKRETDAAEWGARYSHQALSHNGRLYVLGGIDGGGGNLNDVWSSADGKEWTLITLSADWSRRSGHQAVVFPSPLVLFGVGEKITMTAGVAADNLHTFTAQYGKGDYSYSLNPEVSGFDVSPGGVLSADGTAMAGTSHTLSVFVADEEDNRAQTAVRVSAIRLSLSFLNASEEWILPAGWSDVLKTLTASGGSGDYTYTLSPPGSGFVIDANGVLSADGTATPGEYTITVEVTDEINSHPATWTGKVIIISAAK